jgi:hypothetical protein
LVEPKFQFDIYGATRKFLDICASAQEQGNQNKVKQNQQEA